MIDENTDEYDHDRTEYATDPEPQGEVTFATPEDPGRPWRNANQLYYQYIILGKSDSEIAEEMECGHATIHRNRIKFGIESRSRSEAQIEYPRLNDPEWLRNQYESGLSLAKIADKIGCSKNGVKNAINRHGIETRSRSEANIEYPRLKDPEWLRNQYESGLSQAKIADKIGCSSHAVSLAFNRHGIETRSRSEALLSHYQRENAVPKSDAPKPPTGENRPTERTQTGDGTNRSYDGPATGIDLSWSDATDADREPWVPYRDEAWLRWQYNDLGHNIFEIADVAGVSKSTILRWMVRHDIPRDTAEAADE